MSSTVLAAPPRAMRQLGIAALVAAVLAGALIALSELTLPDRAPASPPVAVDRETASRYAGIPQDGFALGRPDAPVTVVEFVDMQCPFCGEFDRQQLPALIDRHVRPGDVRLELRTLAFLGEDSVEAAEAVAAAAEQNKLWPFVDRFFQYQGQEQSGYVTPEFLREIAAGVPGLDAEAVVAGGGTAGIERAEREAQAAGIQSTPSFLVGPTGGELAPVEAEDLERAIREAAR